MSAKNAKLMRSQLRTAIQEILPEILTQEVVKGILKNNEVIMNAIKDNVTKQLKQMEERQKDTLNYLIRNSTVNKG